jgi:hypothetical protein
MRRVAVGVETVELLRAHRARQAAAALAAGATLPPEAYVFARSPDGRAAISPDGISHRFQVLAARLGVALGQPTGFGGYRLGPEASTAGLRTGVVWVD